MDWVLHQLVHRQAAVDQHIPYFNKLNARLSSDVRKKRIQGEFTWPTWLWITWAGGMDAFKAFARASYPPLARYSSRVAGRSS